MGNEKANTTLLFDQLRSYAEIKIKLERLKAIRKGSPIFADLMIYTIAACSLMIGFLYASITLAFCLGSLLGSLLAGLGCVAVIFIASGLILLALRKILGNVVTNIIIKKTCN